MTAYFACYDIYRTPNSVTNTTATGTWDTGTVSPTATYGWDLHATVYYYQTGPSYTTLYPVLVEPKAYLHIEVPSWRRPLHTQREYRKTPRVLLRRVCRYAPSRFEARHTPQRNFYKKESR